MGKFNYREAAARINQVRWETNYPSMEDACWAYQNAIREMMRDVVDVLHDYFDERHLKFARYETRHSYVLTTMDRIVIRCDWVGYGITDEMFEIYIADSKASVADYVEKYCNDPDVFPSKESFAYVAYDATPEDVMEFLDITTGDKREIKSRLRQFYAKNNIHSHMKSENPSLIELWIEVVYGMITIPA